jgi:hypothetical protein
MTPDEELIIRQRFHEYLAEQGFAPQAIPQPGRTYAGSHIQTLWDFFLHATLTERTGNPAA